MLSHQAKRLDRLEEKTRIQWETTRDKYWDELFAHFTWHERQAAEQVLSKWFASPPEYKADEEALQRHFTEDEIVLLKRLGTIWATPHFATMREMIETLYVSLQACERVRN